MLTLNTQFGGGKTHAILGQLGKSRLVAAIDADIAGEQAPAKALDADTKGPLPDIHRRVGTAILFESSGGQTDNVAHLPELRFALGEPEVDTTSKFWGKYNQPPVGGQVHQSRCRLIA